MNNMKPNLTDSELKDIINNKKLTLLFTERLYTDYYPIITETTKEKKFGKICEINLNFNIQDNQIQLIKDCLVKQYGTIDKFYFIR